MCPLFVSVIVPNYNHARYLDERIQSILNQTYQIFEIIIMDDKSTDNSIEVINKYKDKPQVSHIVVNEENSGSPFTQWNKGFGLAKGDLIWIAESDDSCSNMLLEEIVKEFKDEKCVLAFAKSILINSDGQQIGIAPYQDGFKKNKYLGREFVKKHLPIGNSINNASSAIFRKDAVMQIDDIYTKYKGIGDKFFWAEIALLGNVHIVPKYLNYYRIHDSNTTNNMRTNGTNQKDNKYFIDYLRIRGVLDIIDLWKINFKSYVIFRNMPYVSDDVRNSIMSTWDFSFLVKSFYCLYMAKNKLNTIIYKMING